MSQSNGDPEGYDIPIHRSLVQPLLWMGVPRNLFLTNIFAVVFGAIFLKTWTVLFIGIGVHFVFKYLGSKDPQFHQVFFRSKSHKLYYYR